MRIVAICVFGLALMCAGAGFFSKKSAEKAIGTIAGMLCVGLGYLILSFANAESAAKDDLSVYGENVREVNTDPSYERPYAVFDSRRCQIMKDQAGRWRIIKNTCTALEIEAP